MIQTSLIEEFIEDFNTKSALPFVVNPSIPVIWFGDVEKYKSSKTKIVTVALNPSLKEFSEKRFNIVDLSAGNKSRAVELSETLNKYFEYNPYDRWFNNFEKVLIPLCASYYGNKKNTAVNIDVYSSIATDPTWGKLSKEQKAKLSRTDLFEKLLAALNPNVILFSGNKDIFGAVFGGFKLEKAEEDINGKKGVFVRKYRKDGVVLLSGRYLQGTPFGGMTDSEIRSVVGKLGLLDSFGDKI